MNSNPKIAIIIPVYNREKLLSDTLNSILEQTFSDWECILVDDGSTDDSLSVLKKYQQKDQRFKVFSRPKELKKGANTCRNYGFLQTVASHIKWFDSDDIMLPGHLEIAFITLKENNLDFVVSDTINFNHDSGDFLEKPYNFDKKEALINAKNFALHQTCWITDDFLGTRQIVEKIKFNEYIVDGDEYNFFIKLMQQPFKALFIDEILTHRRIHENSVTLKNQEDKNKYLAIIATLKFQTANDLVVFNNKELIRWFLSGYMYHAFLLISNKKEVPFYKPAFKLIWRYFSFIKACAFLIALNTQKYFNKGYRILKYARA